MKQGLLIPFLLVFLSVTSSVTASDSLIIYTSEWPPFSSNTSEEKGIFVDIIREAFALSDIEVEFLFEPWARTINNVETGEAFGAFPIAMNEEREEFALFSDPVFMTRNPVIYNKTLYSSYDYQGLDSLREYQIGGLLGWFYLKEWDEKEIVYHPVKNHHSAFLMLEAGRLDLIVFDEFAAKCYLKQHPEFQDNIGISKTPYARKNLYLMVSNTYPGSETLLEIFNTNLKVLAANGFLDHIAAKYDVPRNLILP